MRLTVCVLWAILTLSRGLCGEEPERVVFDFESGGLDGWSVTEGAFGQFVCSRAVYHHHGGAYNKQGTFFLSTLETPDGRPDDRYTGVAESPVFRLSAPDMSLLVGGGNHKSTYVALCRLDGTEVLRATGTRSQVMQQVRWTAPRLLGIPVFLRIVDRHTGGWGHVTFDAFSAYGTLAPGASAEREARRKLATARRVIRDSLSAVRAASIRAAFRNLASRFGDAYRPAGGTERRLRALEEGCDALKSRLADGAEGLDAAARQTKALVAEAADLRRAVLLAHPLLKKYPVLFVVRHQYRPDHHNTATMFQTGTVNAHKFQGGSAIRLLDLRNGYPGTVTTLLDAGANGVARDPEIHFTGERLVFSMRPTPDQNYHIYEMRADGTALRQLTAAPGVTDIDPLYLPDDSIVFTSTREPKFCMCNCHIMGNLYRMDADGANIRQIGKSTLHEGHGALMPDGRILYDRWEYVDRNFGDAQGLWTVNPDGTNHAVYWGNNTNSPGGILDARHIPGTHSVVCVFGSCHDRPWGALAIVDRRLAIDGRGAVIRTWPPHAIDLVGQGNYDTFKRVRPRYEDPYPLAGGFAAGGTLSAPVDFFLCARTVTPESEETGIFLVDSLGNEVLLHRESPGCFSPMLPAPRVRPPAIPPRSDVTGTHGVLYVTDVYEGTHVQGIERGTVASLRVVESPEKRFWTGPAWGGQGVHRPAMNWHSFENKRILGTVPVATDGSCAFRVPADTFVYFQLLDADGMMVQSMRSGTMVRGGETTGCIGCHETRQRAPHKLGQSMPRAATGPPRDLDGWYGPPRLFSFRSEIQPVLDRHCVECHDFGKPAGKVLVLAGDRTLTFNAAYNELWRKGYTKAIGAGPARILPARSWGSHVSPLVKVLRSGHKGVELSEEEFDRIVTWIDINAPYYPTYASAYPANLAGRAPVDSGQLERLSELVGVPFARLARHNTNRGPQVSFDRPALSPCFTGLADRDPAAYKEALKLIEAGRASLARTPRADAVVTRFVPCPLDRQRQKAYEQRVAAERASRRAIASHKKVYDADR